MQQKVYSCLQNINSYSISNLPLQRLKGGEYQILPGICVQNSQQGGDGVDCQPRCAQGPRHWILQAQVGDQVNSKYLNKNITFKIILFIIINTYLAKELAIIIYIY